MFVPTELFVREMEACWLKLGNHSSLLFRDLWRIMAEAFNEAIRANLHYIPLQIGNPDWLVLAPTMGSGKTVGACVFLGLMARLDRYAPPTLKIGGLLACRTIQQCENCVAAINSHAGFAAAISKHSSNAVSFAEAASHPILVITHEALIRAGKEGRAGLQQFMEMNEGRRLLTIIDEALANAIEFHRVTPQSVHKLFSYIPQSIRDKNIVPAGLVLAMLDMLNSANFGSEAHIRWDRSKIDAGLWAELPALFDKLFSDIRTANAEFVNPRWNDPEQRKAELKELQEIIRAVLTVYRHWAMFVKSGGERQVRAAKATLPYLVCPVILNATAGQDWLLDHINTKRIATPKVRSYRNLTLKIARSNGIGKTGMKQYADNRLKRLARFISEASEPSDRWLVVTHKDIEALAAKHLCSETVQTAHWGALDGLNTFNDCNKAVLFGISYRDPNWSSEVYFALRGVQSEDWFKSKDAKAIKHDIETKLIAAQLLQAIGRPRSRNVCDADGNCLPTTIYMMLPATKLGNDIEKHIRTELPDVIIQDWDYYLPKEAHASTANPASTVSQALLTYMKNAPPGRHLVNDVCAKLKLTRKQRSTVKDALKKGRKIVDDLTLINVGYYVEGKGRAAKSYLIKEGSAYGGKPLKLS